MLWLLFATPAPAAPIEVFGKDCGVRVVRSGSEWVEELYGIDERGRRRLILASPTHPRLKASATTLEPNLLQGANAGLFQKPPTFAFSSARREQDGVLVLASQAGDWKIEKRITVPATGREIEVRVTATTASPYPVVRYLLTTYAFVPGQPDTTYSPGLRPEARSVVGDHFFRAPLVLAQKGTLAAGILPDLDVLSDNRPIPTIVDLDCNNGVVEAPLLSYGFSDYRLTGHVYFASDASMVRSVPWELTLGMHVRLDARAEPFAGYRPHTRWLWERYGARYFDKVLPQAMPFEEYARVCYPAAFAEKETGGWFEHEIGGVVCGGLPSGWGLREGWVSWQAWFNQLRSAWGLRWWGKKLGEKDWIAKADKMLNLALAAPMDQGAVPTTYLSRTREWKGCLITPSPECYYDLTNIAWKGLWLLKWLEFDDCPRREEIARQLRAMADLMLRFQNRDGSFPTWLTKDLKVVPILDRSAQTALPTWFLARFADSQRLGGPASAYRQAASRGGQFLVRHVVDKQRYYDFETFFSCSPKRCLQRDGKLDDLAMWDLHTLQAPQNTLCMQWTAEALNALRASDAKAAGSTEADPARLATERASGMALDIMALYQNVWPISYRKVAYTYGGFGVQNSDGEYNDARQAQFGATLCHFGAQLGRKDYFQRGVAAIRAGLTLIHHPRHIELGLYRNPNYPLGLQPENCGHGGTEQQNGRTGFDWGEGSALAAAAEVLDAYGEVYAHRKDWVVEVDGHVPEVEQAHVAMADGSPRLWVGFRGADAGDLSVTFRDAGGRRIAATVVPPREQSGAVERASYAAPAGHSGLQGMVVAHVSWKGRQWTVGPFPCFVDPVFDFKDWRMPGWTIKGDFLNWPTRSTRMDFHAQGLPFLGTCEDGRGGFDDTYTGTIESPPFLVTKGTIQLLVGGGSGPGVYVELLDEQGTRLYVEHGRNTERMDERTWDVSAHRGKPLRIRIVDAEKGGWGHINVGRIRVE